MHIDVFQTLADPTRRQIVEVLRGGELAVNDIVDAVDIDQSGVSRHLRILYESGFVDVRPEGPRRVTRFAPSRFRNWTSGCRGIDACGRHAWIDSEKRSAGVSDVRAVDERTVRSDDHGQPKTPRCREGTDHD